MYFVGLSGPPRSGKDSIGAALAIKLRSHGGRVQLIALSMPMRKAIYAAMGIEYSVEHYELHKDMPLDIFGGSTIRQEMIQFSETFIKPRLGHDFWARAGLNSAQSSRNVLIVTDMGFDSEVVIFESALGPENCVWAQVERENTDFSNDSRNYCRGVRNTLIVNDSDVDTAAARLYGRLVNQFAWTF